MNDTKNLRKVTLSSFVAVLLGICYMFLKLTAVLPKVVPYSDLIMNLQIGSVQNVLFEEGSRRIYYNTVPESSNDPQLLENPTPSEDVVSSENVGDTGVLADQTKKLCVLGGSVLGKFTKKKVSAREWQYSNRKIDHDENFLLTLMREKGTTYSSAPQSVLMSMRNILITILSLWIPLTSLMWLLYRQASAANSPAKKRHPTNQIVSFDDVEGVDTAKAELLEGRSNNIPIEKIVHQKQDQEQNKPRRVLSKEQQGSSRLKGTAANSQNRKEIMNRGNDLGITQILIRFPNGERREQTIWSI